MSQARTRVLIGMPAYGGLIHCDTVNAILRYQACGIDFALMAIGNESLITRARNSIISEFDARTEFSHLLFLDADVLLPAPALARMLAFGHDVVGAAVALKRRDEDGNRVFNIGRSVGDAGACIEVERIGTAALLLSRRAVAALVADARAHGAVYRVAPDFLGMQMRAPVQYDIFRVGVVDDEYLSEDFWVCRQLRQLGFAIHLDPTIVTRHTGMIAA